MRHPLAIIALTAASLSGAVLAGPAFAGDDDEIIATAQAKPSAQALAATPAATPAAPTPVKQLTTQEQIAAFIAANPGPEIDGGPRGLLPADRDENGKRKVHGEMGMSVGTGGYRSAYASGLFPVGENATVGIAVSKTDFGKHGGGWYDPYYGGGYGLGYGGGYGLGYGGGYGPGYGRARGGESQSVALSIVTGNRRGGGGTPDGCAPGFRDGGRYVEPLWVEGMRDGNHPCAAADGR